MSAKIEIGSYVASRKPFTWTCVLLILLKFYWIFCLQKIMKRMRNFDRIGRIKSKAGCSVNLFGGPATCTGEYEILCNITFDAPITSGDAPPITIFSLG